MKIAIGCDPNAEEAKKELIQYIEKKGYGDVTDFGSVDPIGYKSLLGGIIFLNHDAAFGRAVGI